MLYKVKDVFATHSVNPSVGVLRESVCMWLACSYHPENAQWSIGAHGTDRNTQMWTK